MLQLDRDGRATGGAGQQRDCLRNADGRPPTLTSYLSFSMPVPPTLVAHDALHDMGGGTPLAQL